MEKSPSATRATGEIVNVNIIRIVKFSLGKQVEETEGQVESGKRNYSHWRDPFTEAVVIVYAGRQISVKVYCSPQGQLMATQTVSHSKNGKVNRRFPYLRD